MTAARSGGCAARALASAFLISSTLASIAQPVAGQTSATPMELNRAGRWAEAATVARERLEAGRLPTTTRCELRSQLAYALVRTGRAGEAEAEIGRFDHGCDALPADHWARREVDRLRDQVGRHATRQPAAGPAGAVVGDGAARRRADRRGPALPRDRAAGEPVEDLARRGLFEPLGMTDTRLHVYPEGQAWTHADMETTARDLARIGQLMLQGGRWKERQVVPETWVEATVTPSQRLRPDYGLLWWLDVPDGYAARGYLDTNLYVLPDRELVVVRMQAAPVPGAEPYEPAAFELFDAMVAPPARRQKSPGRGVGFRAPSATEGREPVAWSRRKGRR